MTFDLRETHIQIIFSPSASYIPSLKFRQHSLLEISCLQSFHTLTSGDLKWPLTSMKNNRDHLLTKAYQRTKFEVQATFTSWDIVFTSKASHTHTHTHARTHTHTHLRQGIKNESLIIKVKTFGIRGNLTGTSNIWSITIPNVYILHICNHLC